MSEVIWNFDHISPCIWEDFHESMIVRVNSHNVNKLSCTINLNKCKWRVLCSHNNVNSPSEYSCDNNNNLPQRRCMEIPDALFCRWWATSCLSKTPFWQQRMLGHRKTGPDAAQPRIRARNLERDECTWSASNRAHLRWADHQFDNAELLNLILVQLKLCSRWKYWSKKIMQKGVVGLKLRAGYRTSWN